MNFHEWILGKFIEWRGDTRNNITQFAAYLEISQPTVSAWLNKTRGQPTTPKIINTLAEKFGPEIYDVLGMARPASVGLSPNKRKLLMLLDDINDDQETERVIAELEVKLANKHRKS